MLDKVNCERQKADLVQKLREQRQKRLDQCRARQWARRQSLIEEARLEKSSVEKRVHAFMEAALEHKRTLANHVREAADQVPEARSKVERQKARRASKIYRSRREREESARAAELAKLHLLIGLEKGVRKTVAATEQNTEAALVQLQSVAAQKPSNYRQYLESVRLSQVQRHRNSALRSFDISPGLSSSPYAPSPHGSIG